MTICISEEKPKRRDKLVIMAEIIDIARKGASKTHIMFKANLSFSQLNQYLSALCQSNLLEKFTSDGREYYKPTAKGLDFMEKQCQIISLLNEDTHPYSINIKTSLLNCNILPRRKLFIH
jgi:predicted transcriptional regulator